jgi:Swi5-dependent recombination DNA repair protein 1
MYTPAAKKRRIEAASSTLSKPFRSPFKSPLKAAPSSPSSTNTTNDPSPSPILSEKPPNLSPAIPARRIQSVQKKYPSPSASITSQLNTDPEIAALLRTQRELEKQLREVRENLETAEQARKIEMESRKTGEIDGDLIALIEKWRAASRQAAEELFGKVRDRVNRFVSFLFLIFFSKCITNLSLQNGWSESMERNPEETARIPK